MFSVGCALVKILGAFCEEECIILLLPAETFVARVLYTHRNQLTDDKLPSVGRRRCEDMREVETDNPVIWPSWCYNTGTYFKDVIPS